MKGTPHSYHCAVRRLIQIQIHMFIADIKVHIQYTIKIFKLKCYNDFTLYLNTNHNQLTIIK